MSLEACGQLGVDHGSHHEKTEGAWTADARRWLSVCCCAACQSGWSERGLDPPWVVSTLRDAIRAEASGLVGVVPFADGLLSTRHAAADELRAAVLSALEVPVTLHAHPDPWETGSSPGLTATAASSVASLTVPAWPTAPETADLVVRAVRTGRPVDAYVTVLPPADPAEVGPRPPPACRGRDRGEPVPPGPGAALASPAAARTGAARDLNRTWREVLASTR